MPARFALLILLFAAAQLRILGAPAASSLGLPGRANDNVSLAAARGLVVAVWTSALPAGGSDVYAAVSLDGGASYGRPVRVNARPGDAKTNGEQPPRVAVVERGATTAIVVVWTAPGSTGTRIVSAESVDGGKTFGPTNTVAASAGNRGWESLAIDRSGRAWVLWLDHEKTAVKPSTAAPAHDHQHQAPASAEAAVARAQLSELVIATISAGGARKTLAAGVCYCCKTALTTAADGTIYAAWRHVYPGNHRDIAFTLSRDGGQSFAPPTRVSDDSWEINGCPENGPALAADSRGWVHVVWPTLVRSEPEPRLALFWAVSRDGKTFSSRQQIPTEGDAFHPQVIVEATGSLLVAWDELVNGTRRVSLARGEIDAAGNARFTPLPSALTGSYPALAAAPTGSIVAWTNRSSLLPGINIVPVN